MTALMQPPASCKVREVSEFGSVAEAHRALNRAAILHEDAEEYPGLHHPDPEDTFAQADDIEAAALAFLYPDDDTKSECRDLASLSQAPEAPTKRSPRVAALAADERLNLASEARADVLAIDMTESLDAANSAEVGLAHQLAAAQALAMKLVGRVHAEIEGMHRFDRQGQRETMVEIARLSNAAGRLMDTYQRGLLALAKIRSGGKQTVIVQHVQVNDGGQAVVAGQVGTAAEGGCR